ncbi:MAG: polysaccharide biosynthesis/export family protein [Acidobacteria bacterium]|nr:polysaccharide biosynthesis/export family protein [Acidobacteriota bacterium]
MPLRLIPIAVFLLLSGTLVPVIQAADIQGITLLSLSVSPGKEETGVQILTEGSQSDFTCSRRIIEGQPGLALSFPLAVSRLKKAYLVGGRHLRSIEVIGHGGEAPAPVEILLRLSGDSFWSLQQTEGRIRVSLRRPAGAFPGSMAERYRVGPGDRLAISVFGQEDLEQLVEVKADGSITFPLIGEVQVKNMSIEDVRDELKKRLAKDFIIDPQISVDVDQYRSQEVSVVGEVQRQGRYFLKGATTLIEILAEAGGLSSEAGSEILVSRKTGTGNPGNERRQISIGREQLYSRMGPEENIVLADGDIINVVPKKIFYIRGAVSRPGPYSLEEGTTLLKAISMAGGVGDFANRKEVEILRDVQGKKERIVVNLRAIEKRKREDLIILPDDIINVPRKFL